MVIVPQLYFDFDTPAELKCCCKCHVVKSIIEFGKDIRRVDKLFPQCKRCRLKHPELTDATKQAKAQGLHWCSRCKKWLSPFKFGPNISRTDGLHSECRLCAVITSQQYRLANIDIVNAKDKKYRERNPEKRMFFRKRYYIANSHKLILRAHGIRRKYDIALDTLTGSEWKQIIREQGDVCAHCKQTFTSKFIPTRDHILPFSKGGYLTKENTQALCRRCNTSKGTKTVRY